MRVIITDEDRIIMEIAQEEAKKSTCVREGRQVGALLVDDGPGEGKILCRAHNRSPFRGTGCKEKGCVKDEMRMPSGLGMEVCDVLHAEGMLVAKCAREGIVMRGMDVYSTCEPCLTCARFLVVAGIKRFTYLEGSYSTREGIELLERGKIPVRGMQLESHEVVDSS